MNLPKSFVLVAATVVLGLASAPRAKAGGDEVAPETAPAPRYEQPQERVYYAPPVYYPSPVVTVGVYPGFGFYGGPWGYYGYHRYYGRGYWRGGRRWR